MYEVFLRKFKEKPNGTFSFDKIILIELFQLLEKISVEIAKL